MHISFAKSFPLFVNPALLSGNVEVGDVTNKARLIEAEAERDQALEEMSRTKEEVRRLASKTGGADSGTIKVLTRRLEDAERVNAKLMSRNTTLDTEMEAFKTYMQQTVARYQTMTTQLQGEIKQLKSGGRRAGVD
ncbi:unnamed protein product [Choristocarpus tenellus]